MQRLGLVLVTIAAAVGCSGDDASSSLSGGVGSETAVVSAGSDSEGTTTSGSTSATGTSSGGGVMLDLAVPDGGSVPGTGCTKVDFLFVIDSSNSMRHHQENLAASFPGFIGAIEDALTDAHDYHIMVVDTDPDATAICQGYCEIDVPICSGYTCGDAPMFWGECDMAHGAGVRHPLGLDASNMDCGFATEDRYITDAQPELAETFACAAKVGTSTNKEWQLHSLAEAVSDGLGEPGGCNAGFLRDDALLVVTLITDEPDIHSGATPAEWKQAVVDAKLGDEDAIVMLGLISDVDDPDTICMEDEGYPKPAPDMHEFVDAFPNNIKGSVCEPDYTPFFVNAVSLIDTACDEYTPPG